MDKGKKRLVGRTQYKTEPTSDFQWVPLWSVDETGNKRRVYTKVKNDRAVEGIGDQFRVWREPNENAESFITEKYTVPSAPKIDRSKLLNLENNINIDEQPTMLDEVVVVGTDKLKKDRQSALEKLISLNIDQDTIDGLINNNRAIELINKLNRGQITGALHNRYRGIPKFGEKVKSDDVDYFYNYDIPGRLLASRGPEYIYPIEKLNEIPVFFPSYDRARNDKFYSTGRATGLTTYDSKGNQEITLNPYFNPDYMTIAHEKRHGLQNLDMQLSDLVKRGLGGYTDKEAELLRLGYDKLQGYQYHTGPLKENEITSYKEKGATNTEVRYKLLEMYKNIYKRYPTINELNEFIDKTTDDTILNLIKTSNGYGGYMGKRGGLNIKYIRPALKYVAYNDNNSTLYGKSGIKIKKKNRGKFTEYCGGNVTQECINRAKNSGNSKLIKRSVFAENARKWKKK